MQNTEPNKFDAAIPFSSKAPEGAEIHHAETDLPETKEAEERGQVNKSNAELSAQPSAERSTKPSVVPSAQHDSDTKPDIELDADADPEAES
jgi:hypothetical protein